MTELAEKGVDETVEYLENNGFDDVKKSYKSRKSKRSDKSKFVRSSNAVIGNYALDFADLLKSENASGLEVYPSYNYDGGKAHLHKIVVAYRKDG